METLNDGTMEKLLIKNIVQEGSLEKEFFLLIEIISLKTNGTSLVFLS